MKKKKIKVGQNTGVLFVNPFLTDWIAGVASGITYKELLPSGDWSPYRPTDEAQFRRGFFDTMSCVTYAGLNSVEEQCNFLMASGAFSEKQVAKLRDLGVIDANDKFNFSDHFSAIMNGTTANGNYLQAFWDSARKDGLLGQSKDPITADAVENIDQWLDPAKVSQAQKDIAKELLKILSFNYEWVLIGQEDNNLIAKHLKHAPLHIATPVAGGWNTEDIIQNDGRVQLDHATSIMKINPALYTGILDHYDPYSKKLAPNYFLRYAVKGVVTVVPEVITPPAPTISYTFNQDLKFRDGGTGTKKFTDVQTLQKILIAEGYLKTTATGLFWTQTQNAVVRWQVANGVPGTGLFGPISRKVMNAKYGKVETKSLVQALIEVESGGDDNAIGDLHLTQKAYGCLQIRQPVCIDVNKINGTTLKATDMLGRRDLSIDTYNKYMAIYATEKALGRTVTDQDRARIWNGGPTGWKRSTTLSYWKKVQTALLGNFKGDPMFILSSKKKSK